MKIIAILISLVLICTGIFLAVNYNNQKTASDKLMLENELTTPNVMTEVEEASQPHNSPNTTQDGNTPELKVTQPTAFQVLLDAECKTDEKIELSKLPFTIDANIKVKHKITDTMDCYVPLGTSDNTTLDWSRGINAYITNDVKQEHNQLILGDANTKDWAMSYAMPYAHEDKYNLKVDDVLLNITLPYVDPYGMSNLGTHIQFLAYKKVGDYVVVSSTITRFKMTDEVNELIQAYADDNSNMDGAKTPEGYLFITANNKRDEYENAFLQKYILSYPNIGAEYKAYIDSVVEDVAGVDITPQ